MRSRYTTEGYLTVTCALVMTVMLSLVLAFFASARHGAAAMRAESVTEISLDATLAEYHRALFDRYGLLLLDTSYGTPVADICNTEERLRMYLQTNFEASALSAFADNADLTGLYCESVSIPSFVRAYDANGAVLRRQILAYMTAEPLEEALVDATKDLNVLRAEGYDSRDVASEMDAHFASLSQQMGAGDRETAAAETDAFAVYDKRRLGILTLAHPDRISDAACTPSVYLSHRSPSVGNVPLEAESLSLTEQLLIDQYLFETCGSHADVRDDSRLDYQIEYILAGKGSDFENLESVAYRLLAIREASNFAYIMKDNGKKMAAGAIGWAVALLLLTPSLHEPIKTAVLFAWSFAESVADLKTLYAGGQVPLIKTADTWQTSLLGMIGFGSGKTCGSGPDYEGYLRILMLMTDLDTKTKRFADIVEMDMRETEGNLHFRLDACLDALGAEVVIANNAGYAGKFQRYVMYTEE